MEVTRSNPLLKQGPYELAQDHVQTSNHTSMEDAKLPGEGASLTGPMGLHEKLIHVRVEF